MRAAGALLHGLSLSACVALGAGFWQLRGTLTTPVLSWPPPLPPAALAQAPSAEQGEGIHALAREVDNLRARIRDLEDRSLPAVQAPPPGVPVVSSPPAVAESPGGLLAALDDPKGREKLRMLREDEERKARLRMEPFNMVFGGMSLDEAKRQALEGLMAQSSNDITAAFLKLHAREWTRDQVRNQTELVRVNLDARVRPFLTEDQYRTYLESVTPMRQAQDRWLANPAIHGTQNQYLKTP